MGRRRFFAPQGAFSNQNKNVSLESDEARHLSEVLRLGPGDEVFVFDGAGREFRCSITNVSRKACELTVVEEVTPQSPESPLRLSLAISMLKGEKLDLVVQKA